MFKLSPFFSLFAALFGNRQGGLAGVFEKEGGKY